MTINFDDLTVFTKQNYVTTTKLKKLNNKNVKHVTCKSFDIENKFLSPIRMCSQNKTSY